MAFYEPDAGSPMASTYLRKHRSVAWYPTGDIQVRTLDGVAQEEGISSIDLLKLDVEGHELAVLEGARETLARTRAVQFEFGGSNIDSGAFLRDIVALLGGFRIYRLLADGLRPLRYDERFEVLTTTNFLALREPATIEAPQQRGGG